MTTFNVPAHLMQAIADYLVERPYKEVAPLLAEIAKLSPTPMKDSDD